ncbi:amidohydrolase [Seinonella peptonophila]|uniref:Amidohydrolase n=1 Tax=Seinonella peptonophila TaxID=112248 RepID=A0A1M4SJJ4_9BACL|nr:amidohydrolase [Seinonella peptonophila]SHE32349.1 amidohydrolase [Seinonella peptonophila]
MLPHTYLEQHREDIIHTYQKLHKIAEPSWQEKYTAQYLSQRLSEAGLQVRSFPGHHGFVAEIPGLSESVIALRADMDAIIQEVQGEMIANHSCGHDAHSTMVLYTALALAAYQPRFPYTLRFLFQPAEEVAGGALQMMKDGVLENVKMLFGIHLRPWMEVPYGKAAPVIIHRSSATIRGTITGRSSHAARPQEAIHPILAMTNLLHSIQKIKLEGGAFSATITQLESGNRKACNVIPESATFTLDLRADTDQMMKQLQQLIIQCIQATTLETGTFIKWRVTDYVPATIPNDYAIEIAKQSIIKVLGKRNLVPVCHSPGGEDFHFYTQQHPELIATMIGLGCDLQPGLHHPDMTFNQEALLQGAQILTALLLSSIDLMQPQPQKTIQ